MEKTKIYLVFRSRVFNFPKENRMESTEEICGIFDDVDKARELAKRDLARTRAMIGEEKTVKEGMDFIDYLVEGGYARKRVGIEQVDKMNVELPYYGEEEP